MTDAYQRRCAVTGERTLPVLDAALIRPYAELGPHWLENGILLRKDLDSALDRLGAAIDQADAEANRQPREQKPPVH